MNKTNFVKEGSTLKIDREFNASRDLVWDTYTKPELLDRWWAPKPWVAKTRSMEFEVGGRRLYVMCGPNGEEHWALADFTSISPKTNFQYLDAFCDSAGNISNELPRSNWDLDFIDKGDTTSVNITIMLESEADLEKIVELGFKEGFSIALDLLDELLLSLNH